jgi:hypothetical protein
MSHRTTGAAANAVAKVLPIARRSRTVAVQTSNMSGL